MKINIHRLLILKLVFSNVLSQIPILYTSSQLPISQGYHSSCQTQIHNCKQCLTDHPTICYLCAIEYRLDINSDPPTCAKCLQNCQKCEEN
jgi:hypothetical protein